MRRIPASLITCVLMAALLAACAGNPTATPAGPGGQTPPPAGAPGTAPDACAALTDAEVETATGKRILERRVSTLTQVFPSVCDMELEGNALLTVSIKATGGRELWECCFKPFIGGEVIDEEVPGLGDQAGRSGDSMLMVLKGDTLFDLHYIEFGRTDRDAVVRYLAERILDRLDCPASGCPAGTPPPTATPGPPTATPAGPRVDPADLPSTGARARVVNLYSENGQPVTVDVYAYMYSAAEMNEVGALVATVPYGTASEWFNPGLLEYPFDSVPGTKVTIVRQGDQPNTFDPLVSVTELLGAETLTTIAVWQEEVFEGQPDAWAQTIYAQHPDYEVPQAPPGAALLISRDVGMRAEGDAPFMYASAGDGCLESPLGRTYPDIPNVQPISNDLLLPLGERALTVHVEPLGELPTCKTDPLGAGVPLTVAAGERYLAFPYRLPGDTEVSLLVVPFDPR